MRDNPTYQFLKYLITETHSVANQLSLALLQSNTMKFQQKSLILCYVSLMYNLRHATTPDIIFATKIFVGFLRLILDILNVFLKPFL